VEEGAKEYWLVDPDRKEVEVYVNGNDGLVLSGSYADKARVISLVLTDGSFIVSDLWQ
jgi:Uma2 family endonuclease